MHDDDDELLSLDERMEKLSEKFQSRLPEREYLNNFEVPSVVPRLAFGPGCDQQKSEKMQKDVNDPSWVRRLAAAVDEQ